MNEPTRMGESSHIMSRPLWQGGYLRLAQVLLLLSGEVGWMIAWSVVVGKWIDPAKTDPVLNVIVIVALLAASVICARAVLTRARSLKLGQVGLALLGVGLALALGAQEAWLIDHVTTWSSFWATWEDTSVGFRSVGVVVLTVLIWWRGIVVAREPINTDFALSDFRTAFFLLASALVMNLLVPPAVRLPESAFVVPILLVLFSGLASLPFAQILDVSERRTGSGTASVPLNRYWLAMLLAGIAALIVIANILALVLSFEQLDSWFALFAGPLGDLFWSILYVILLGAGYLVAGLIYAVRFILHPGQAPPPARPPTIDLAKQLHQMAQGGPAGPIWLFLVAKWIAIGVLALIVIGLLARAVFRYVDWRTSDDVEELRDFVWSWRWLGLALRSWLERMRHRVALTLARPVPASVERSALLDRSKWGPRELYRELLRLGARLGRRRAPAETPIEYERALGSVLNLARGKQDVHVLTRLYVQARYSPDAVAASEVTAARSALDRLEADSHETGAGAPRNDSRGSVDPP